MEDESRNILRIIRWYRPIPGGCSSLPFILNGKMYFFIFYIEDVPGSEEDFNYNVRNVYVIDDNNQAIDLNIGFSELGVYDNTDCDMDEDDFMEQLEYVEKLLEMGKDATIEDVFDLINKTEDFAFISLYKSVIDKILNK